MERMIREKLKIILVEVLCFFSALVMGAEAQVAVTGTVTDKEHMLWKQAIDLFGRDS